MSVLRTTNLRFVRIPHSLWGKPFYGAVVSTKAVRGTHLQSQERSDGLVCLFAGFPEIVVDNDPVEMMFERDLIRGLIDPGHQAFVSLRPSAFQPAAQLVHGWRFDEKGQGGLRVLFPDVDRTF